MSARSVAGVAAVVVLLVASNGALAGPPTIGDAPPEIDAKEWYNTPPLALASLKGKVVVVEFWATWCPPCRASIPHLVELHNKYSGKGVVIIGLSDEPPAVVKPFVSKMGMVYAVGAGSRSGSAYGVRGIPHAFIVDPEGKVAWTGHPMAMDEPLERVLRETPPVLAGPADIARARKAIEDAERALRTHGYARAASLLAGARRIELPADLSKRADEVAAAIESAASARLEEAKKLVDSGRAEEASTILSELTRSFPGTRAAEEAKLVRGKLQAEPADSGAEREARALLTMAKSLLQAGEKDKAKELFERLTKEFPDSGAARAAREELNRLK